MDPRTDIAVTGWRGLAREVSARIGRPLGVNRVRYRVEASGLSIGSKIGASMVFTVADVERTVRLYGGIPEHPDAEPQPGEAQGGAA